MKIDDGKVKHEQNSREREREREGQKKLEIGNKMKKAASC